MTPGMTPKNFKLNTHINKLNSFDCLAQKYVFRNLLKMEKLFRESLRLVFCPKTFLKLIINSKKYQDDTISKLKILFKTRFCIYTSSTPFINYRPLKMRTNKSRSPLHPVPPQKCEDVSLNDGKTRQFPDETPTNTSSSTKKNKEVDSSDTDFHEDSIYRQG